MKRLRSLLVVLAVAAVVAAAWLAAYGLIRAVVAERSLRETGVHDGAR